MSSVLARDVPPADPREIDAPTLRAAQRREPRACRALVLFYEKRVYAFLWRMLEYRHGQAVVEELCQETFLRVFAHLARFEIDGPARLSTWMLTIAARLALNQLRRREPEVLDAAALIDQRAEGESGEALARSELARLVGRALASLPPEHRAAIVLREYHELGYAEIAAALAIDLGTWIDWRIFVACSPTWCSRAVAAATSASATRLPACRATRLWGRAPIS